jgi:PAS domain S-box-containing protein
MEIISSTETLNTLLFDTISSICEDFNYEQSLEEFLAELSKDLGIFKIYTAFTSHVEFNCLLERNSKNELAYFDSESQLQTLLFPIIKIEKVFGFIVLKGEDLTHLSDPTSYRSIQKFAFVIGQQIWIWKKLNENTEALEKAIEERNFFESILSNNPTEVVVLNNDFKYVYLNKHAIKSEELRNWMVGKDDFEYCKKTNRDDRIAVNRRKFISKIQISKKPQSFEETFNLPDGTFITQLRMLHPVLDGSDNIVYTIGFSINITKIKEQERLINLQKEAIINSPDGIAILDPSGRYVFMNRAYEVFFDYEVGELIGENWETVYSQEEEERLKAEVFPILMQNRIWRGETTGTKKNGELIYQDLTLRMMEDNSLICATQDISALKSNYQLLKETNQKLELAIEANQLGMWSWNLTTKKVEGNNHFFNVFFDKNYEKNHDPFERFLNNIHPDDLTHVKKAFDKLLQRNPENLEPYQSIEYRIQKSKSDYTWIMMNVRVISFDENGNPQQIIGFILDTNEIIEAEHKIRENERKFKELVENLREVIFETDAELNFSFLNAAWKLVTGHSPEDFIGSSLHLLFETDIQSKIKNFIQAQVDDSLAKNIQLEAIIKNEQGQPIWLDIAISIKSDKMGNFIGVRGSFEDITLRKNAELELLKALANEKELNELKSRFVNMVSHELRTPLAGIYSSAEIMELRLDKNKTPIDETLSNAFKNKIQHILQDVERITSLITDVLTIGQIDSSRVKFNPIANNLKDYIVKYLNSEASRVIGNHTLNFIDKVKQPIVNFDSVMISHILNNIIGNAAKYSDPTSEVKIEIENIENYFKIEVSDKGIGIPKEELDNIFTSFFRSSNVENIPGTGLGLSIAKYFTELHEGKINISSKLGKGTTITICIPICQ